MNPIPEKEAPRRSNGGAQIEHGAQGRARANGRPEATHPASKGSGVDAIDALLASIERRAEMLYQTIALHCGSSDIGGGHGRR